MKTRLACRLARTWCALREDARPRHVAGCPDCQAHFAATRALTVALAADAGSAGPAPFATLDRRILEAVARDQRTAHAPAPRRSWGGLLSLAGAAAALALGLFVYQRTTAPTPVPDTPAFAGSAADATALVDTVNSLSTQLADEVIPSAGTLIADNPIQDELSAVYSDAKSALDFLALNFLPKSSALAMNELPAPR